jgi:class 3 adenylate cyclase
MGGDALDLATIGVACAVATSHLYLAAFGFVIGRHHRRVNYLFSLALLAAAWWALWTGMFHVGFYRDHPRSWGMPQLVSGYIQPAMFLFARSVVRPERPPSNRALWLLVAGLPGTILGVALLAWPDLAASEIAKFEESLGRTNHLGLRVLHGLHSAESFGFALANVAILGWGSLYGQTSEVRTNARAVLVALVGSVAAIALVNIIPLVTGELTAATRFAPAFTIPVAFITYRALVSSKAQMERLRREREHLAPYVPRPALARAETEPPRLGGSEQEVSVLFADIRGFTGLTEKMTPTEVVTFVNRFFAETNAAATANHGMVNKFIGDAVLLVFGLTDARDHHASSAVHCAQDLVARLARFNEAWTAEGHEPVRIGIGVATGRAVHGNVGTADRMEYTVMGDVVNTASRVEAMTKELGLVVLVTEGTARAIPEAERAALRLVGRQRLRGRSEETELYTLAPIA